MKKIMFNDRYGLTEAVLSGRKTMTRRIIKSKNIIARHWNPDFNVNHCYYTDERGRCQLIDTDTNKIIIPQYNVGEVVAVAQSYKDCTEECIKTTGLEVTTKPHLAKVPGYKNKMFVRADLMPHHIRITDIKVERLQDISDEDFIKEGVREVYVNNNWGNSASHWEFQVPYEDKLGRTKLLRGATPQEVYAALIDKISGYGTWDSNPLVFAYEFEMKD